MRFVPLLALLAACGSDHGLSGLCGMPQRGFDIEDVSVLQDAQGYAGMHDAVILEFDPSELPPGAAWRVRSVEILPMIGQSEFEFFETFYGSPSVSVEIWDADNPLSTQPYVVTQTFDKDALEWEDQWLSSPASAFEQSQKSAWWRFGFEDVIPTSGMVSTNYLVGIVWESNYVPALGYSNFNLPCDLNWTDYDDGFGWVLNQDLAGAPSCSWPMLRVNLEILEQVDDCEGESYSIE